MNDGAVAIAAAAPFFSLGNAATRISHKANVGMFHAKAWRPLSASWARLEGMRPGDGLAAYRGRWLVN